MEPPYPTGASLCKGERGTNAETNKMRALCILKYLWLYTDDEHPDSIGNLAGYLAVERSGLSLELGKMKKDGFLDFHKSHFVLKV